MGIRLYSPLTKLQVNTEMPVYVMGVNEHATPFSLANVFPPLSFKWSTTSRYVVPLYTHLPWSCDVCSLTSCCSEVASLESVYHASRIQLPVESRFSNQLHAHRQGHTTVKVVVSVVKKSSSSATQQLVNNEPISDEIHVQVIIYTLPLRIKEVKLVLPELVSPCEGLLHGRTTVW